MKKKLLVAILTLLVATTFATTHTITNVGFTFSPADLTIDLGDTVVFDLLSMHNAVEVSESTWNSDGNTPLPGFSVGFGGGIVTGLEAGTHFYVCQPHAASGMKGKITVNAASGINDYESSHDRVIIYPNPVLNNLTIELKGTNSENSGQMHVRIFNILGEKVYEIQKADLLSAHAIDVSNLKKGDYILRIDDGTRVYSQLIVKE
jgi:plastocyanin